MEDGESAGFSLYCTAEIRILEHKTETEPIPFFMSSRDINYPRVGVGVGYNYNGFT